MTLSGLTFIVTDDCNFNCSYCMQKKEKKSITNSTIDAAIDFFYPFLKGDTIRIGFYGGEPLLAYDRIEHAVRSLQERNRRENKKIEFLLTTNGSLLSDEMLDFFERTRFSLVLSFDGLAQDRGRKRSTLEQMARLVEKIRRRPGIAFEINSVFSPRTVAMLCGSLRFMIEPGGPDIRFNLDSTGEWQTNHLDTLSEQLRQLGDFLVRYYEKTGEIPVKNFRASRSAAGVFRCSGGSDHMAVTPAGDIWGCFLFHDYFKTRRDDPQYRDFFFGTLRDFTTSHKAIYPEIAANYADLSQDLFGGGKRDCFLCRVLEDCTVCPVNAAFSSGSLGKVSCTLCRLNTILKNARKRFQQRLRE